MDEIYLLASFVRWCHLMPAFTLIQSLAYFFNLGFWTVTSSPLYTYAGAGKNGGSPIGLGQDSLVRGPEHYIVER